MIQWENSVVLFQPHLKLLKHVSNALHSPRFLREVRAICLGLLSQWESKKCTCNKVMLKQKLGCWKGCDAILFCSHLNNLGSCRPKSNGQVFLPVSGKAQKKNKAGQFGEWPGYSSEKLQGCPFTLNHLAWPLQLDCFGSRKSHRRAKAFSPSAPRSMR